MNSAEQRFAFGENWRGFLQRVDEERVRAAEATLQSLFRRRDFQGASFLDAGCGSGLFSLAAFNLGAAVVSFDVDPDSVACAASLRPAELPAGRTWEVRQGSLRDPSFLAGLGRFDAVYCWGVLHHTGTMWESTENLLNCCAPGGTIVLAIYNDQGYVSRIWSGVKRVYLRLPWPVRPVYAGLVGANLFLRRLAVTFAAALLRLLTLRNPVAPFENWGNERRQRGMDSWHDLVDWVGGWPFEVARPEEVFRFLRDRGFVLTELSTTQGHGCNEFVFRRAEAPE